MNWMALIVGTLKCKQLPDLWTGAKAANPLVISEVKVMLKAWAPEFHLGTNSCITTLAGQVT